MLGYLPNSSFGRCTVDVLIDDDTERMDMLSDALRGDNDVLDILGLRPLACNRPGDVAPNSAPARLASSRLELEALKSSLDAGVTMVGPP